MAISGGCADVVAISVSEALLFALARRGVGKGNSNCRVLTCLKPYVQGRALLMCPKYLLVSGRIDSVVYKR